MRALVRFRWLVPAIAVPLCIALASVGLQAAAFSRPPRDDLTAVKTLHTLLGYRLMRATEEIANRKSSAICLQGWFPERGHRHPVRGSLVLVGSDVRLYDLGSGIHRFGSHGRRARKLDILRFLLAGCPRFITSAIGARLAKSLRVDVDLTSADNLAADAIVFGRRSGIDLYVTRHSYEPIWLAVTNGSVHGSSDLAPGGSLALVRKVRRAFDLRTKRVRSA